MYQLKRSQTIDAPIGEVWDFIARPENLDRITPEDMNFEIISEVPERMYNGLLVEYEVTVPILGRTTWVSEIKHIVEQQQFVDEQRIGPYALWYHYHGVEKGEEGTRMVDRVSYKPPFGPIGDLVNYFVIRPKLESIFDYRKDVVEQLFGE